MIWWPILKSIQNFYLGVRRCVSCLNQKQKCWQISVWDINFFEKPFAPAFTSLQKPALMWNILMGLFTTSIIIGYLKKGQSRAQILSSSSILNLKTSSSKVQPEWCLSRPLIRCSVLLKSAPKKCMGRKKKGVNIFYLTS